MSLLRLHKLTLLLILLCSFIHNIICSDHINNAYIQSINSLSTISTSFILPITLLHSEWFISNPNAPTISLKSFLSTLANHLNPQHITIQLQIDTIEPYNNQINPFLTDDIQQLYSIIAQSDISISKTLILSQTIPIQIMEIISNQNLPIQIHISPPQMHHQSRTLLSNESVNFNVISNTEYEIIEMETYICKPWPIYLGFFAGIGVTVIITWVMNLTTGEKDSELHNAIEKVFASGIETSVANANANNGPLEILGQAPTRHKKYRTNSAILIYPTNQLSRSFSPKSRSRTRSNVMRPTIRHSNEPSWANDLQPISLKDRKNRNNTSSSLLKPGIPVPLKLKGITSSIEEENETDLNSNVSKGLLNNKSENDNNYNELKNQFKHRNSLRIYAKNLLSAPESTITPIHTDITPKSDDMYLSNSSSNLSDNSINGQSQRNSESDLSDLTNTNNNRKSNESESETNDAPIRIITHKQFDYSDAIAMQKKQQEFQGNKQTKMNVNFAQNIDLSPIVEVDGVHFEQYKRYRLKKHKDGIHISNMHGKKIRIGLNICNNNNNNIDVKPYDCLVGTSSENSDNSYSIDDNDNDETQVDEQQSNETNIDDDDGMEGDDESDLYSNDDGDETMIIDDDYENETDEEVP